MFFFGVHIAGWILVALITISFILNFNTAKVRSRGILIRDIKLLFLNSIIAFLVIVSLVILFNDSRTLPFQKTPKLYTESVSYLKRQKTAISKEMIGSLTRCAMGNAYRCLCDIEAIERKYPDSKEIIEVKRIITQGIVSQENNIRFLE